jgi:hypothetical protein
MMPVMAPTPGGGRTPSAQPPTAPPPPKPRASDPSKRPRGASRSAVLVSALRWGVLLGGLVIIVDLATRVFSQRAVSQDDVSAVRLADELLNYILYSILGIAVVRETRVIYAGVLAGLIASLLDAIVIAAAAVVTPPTDLTGSVEELFISNVLVGTLFAGISGLVYDLIQRLSGGRRVR